MRESRTGLPGASPSMACFVDRVFFHFLSWLALFLERGFCFLLTGGFMFEAKDESVGIAISVPSQSSFSSRTLYIDESVSTVDGIFLKTVSALTALCGGGTGGGAGLRGGAFILRWNASSIARTSSFAKNEIERIFLSKK